MDRSQVLIWLLCFSVAPFWGVSEIEEVSSELLEISEEGLHSAFGSLSEEVQSELNWKRRVIDAIDTTREVNEALGFHDPDLGIGDKTIVMGTWALAAGSVYFTQRGWASVVRRVTPDHLRPRNTTTYNNMKKLTGELFDKEVALKKAVEEAEPESSIQTEEGRQSATDTGKDVPAKEGATAGATEQTAKAEEAKPTGATEQTAKAEETKPTGATEKPAQAEETREAGKRARKQKPPVSVTSTDQLIDNQRAVVSNLEKDIAGIKAKLKKTRLVNFKGLMSKGFYGTGHLIRWVSIGGLYLGGVLVQIALAGDAVLIVFDTIEDIDALREQYVADIEAVVREAASYQQ